MCVHYWILDFSDKGICNKCGKEKDFSPPPVKFNRHEKMKVISLFEDDFYMKGKLWLDK